MIDFHSHILPGVDDGAVSIDESIAMAKALAAFGYKTVCCTPHCIRGDYELASQKVREATLMLQADLDNADISLDLWPGMEYMLDESFAAFADDLLPLGETKLILCEAPPQANAKVVREGLDLIVDKGYVPLIAHPERTSYFYEALCDRGEERDAGRGTRYETPPKKTKNFFSKLWPSASRLGHATSRETSGPDATLSEKCLFHANLGSFTGYYGESIQRKAYELLKLGVYTALASDLHDAGSAAKVLVGDKFETNPFLKKLAGFDGTTQNTGDADKNGAGQGELF